MEEGAMSKNRLQALALAMFMIAAATVRAQQIDLPLPGHRVDINPHSLAYEYAGLNQLTFGVDGDSRLIFVTEPLAQRIAVLDRFTGHEVGQVPAPTGGFLLPFSVRVAHAGHLVVLAPGGFPNPNVPSIARVYDYDYQWNEAPHTFAANVTRTVSFAGLPVVFAEDVEVTSSGLYVVAESIIGALWVIHPDGTITPGVFPSSGPPVVALGSCALPVVTVGGIPFGIAGGFAPGVVSLTSRDGQLYFSSTCHGGLYRIPVASLVDPLRTPDQRANDIVAVSPRPAGAAETFEGLAVNRFDSHDNAVYACDSFHLQILRIDSTTGAREVIAGDPLLFNFPSKLQFLPPVFGVSPLVVASDQEHRLAAINAGISHDMLQPPWMVTKILVFDTH
jgi:hypothetical protein